MDTVGGGGSTLHHGEPLLHLIDALIYLPHGPHSARWLDQCILYCEAHHYHILAVVAEWADVIGYIQDGYRGVVVHPPLEQLPPDRLPRFESAGDPEPTPEPPSASGQRRVRRRRRIPEEG